jgi:hypothetical protein
MPIGFLGLPSLHSIIEAIANGFFGALANALVPDFLKHGTVATIQHLVALPDPSTWGHVRQLQGDMTYLAAMLMPVTLAVGTLRYWVIGLTGQAHPATAVTRTVWATGVLVAYSWIVQQTVAATNTLTHAILGFPTVADGLQRIIGVLFGGALLTGAGGVFGAFLVIIGVLFAAGLFAAQVLLTVVLALLIVAGPPLIALSAIPELSHLARAWAYALLATALVPLGWTILFATAGALCLDATSFTGGAAGLSGHVAAAFAGLITFVLAVKLPWMLFGELRRLFAANSLSGHARTATAPNSAPGVERVRAAHARLRSATFDGVPSLGRSVGRAAGAMGAPAGGPLGAARRGFAGAALRVGILPATAAAGVAGAAVGRGKPKGSERAGVRQRFTRAGAILRDAPRDAKVAMAGARTDGNVRSPGRPPDVKTRTGGAAADKHASDTSGHRGPRNPDRTTAYPRPRSGVAAAQPPPAARNANPRRPAARPNTTLRTQSANGPANVSSPTPVAHMPPQQAAPGHQDQQPSRKITSATRAAQPTEPKPNQPSTSRRPGGPDASETTPAPTPRRKPRPAPRQPRPRRQP